MALNTYPYSPFPASTEQIHKGDNEDLQAQIDAIKDGTNIDSFGDVETALEDKTDTAVIAPAFDAEAGLYAVGDLVMYQGKLYEFTTAHETAGDWDSTEVTEKTVSDEIDTVKSGLTNVEDVIDRRVNPTPHYIGGNSTVNVPITSSKAYMLYVFRDSSGYNAVAYVVGHWNGTPLVYVLAHDDNITIASSTDGNITITNGNSGSATYVLNEVGIMV